jgi:hypothetical protein
MDNTVKSLIFPYDTASPTCSPIFRAWLALWPWMWRIFEALGIWTHKYLVLALFATHLVYLAIMLALLYVTIWKLEVKWSILASYHQLRSFREMSQWVFRGCDTGRLNSFGCQWDSTQNSVRAVLHSQFLDLHHLDVSKGTFLKSFYGSFVVVSLM